MKLLQLFIYCLVFVAFVSLSEAKVDPNLEKFFETEKVANIIVQFKDGNSAAIKRSQVHHSGNRSSRILKLVSDLRSISSTSQQNALNLIQSETPFIVHKQIWINNVLHVKAADSQLVSKLAALPEVELIREEIVIKLEPLSNKTVSKVTQWNIEKIQAEAAWSIPGGNNGKNVVVANIDTGVRRTHEALKNNHRASFNWWDPIDETTEASDSHGRGTHTMGVIVGSLGIGVAPGAQWIACKGCDVSVHCPESALIECGQWITCPTDSDGQPDCSKAPDVVSNAWDYGQGNTFYNAVIDAWKAAGIIPVFGIGNEGPNCQSAKSPGDQNVIGVGSTTTNDNIAEDSSVGPNANGIVKPDISAPGDSIRSASSSMDNAYREMSSTGIAAAHVAGTVALLKSRNPNLSYDQVRNLLTNNVDTASLVDTGKTCGGIPSTQFPNNQYGYGRVNARQALAAAIAM